MLKPLRNIALSTELNARKSELDPVCFYCPSNNKRLPTPSTPARDSMGFRAASRALVGEPKADPTGSSRGERANPSFETGGEGAAGWAAWMCRMGSLNSHQVSGSRCKKQNFNRRGKSRLLEYSVYLHRDERERKGNKPQKLL